MEAYLAIETQWRWVGGGMGALIALGLDYGAAQSGLALAGIEVTPELWRAVRLIELGARAALNGERP